MSLTASLRAAESVSMADGWVTVDGNDLPWEVHDVTVEPLEPGDPDMAFARVATLHLIATHVCVDASLGTWVIDGYQVPWFVASPEHFPYDIEGSHHRHLRVSLPLLLFTDQDTPQDPIVWDDDDQAATEPA